MLREVVTMTLKYFGAVLVLVAVWFASGEYQRRNFQNDFDSIVQVRVRKDCQRPEWIRTKQDAIEYDVTVREMDVIADRMELIRQRTTALATEAERVEALRYELARGKVNGPYGGGVGGPAPTPKKK